MGLSVRGQRCDLIDIARSISVAIAFHGGKSGNCDFDKRLTEGFEDLNTGKLWENEPVLFVQNTEGFKLW